MKEKQFQAIFSKWARETQSLPTCAVELKVVKHPKKSLNIRTNFQPQQLPMLSRAKHKRMQHKISDQSVGLKPFDWFTLVGTQAYVALAFTQKHKPLSHFYLIDVDIITSWEHVHNTHLLREEDLSKNNSKKVLLSAGQ